MIIYSDIYIYEILDKLNSKFDDFEYNKFWYF